MSGYKLRFVMHIAVFRWDGYMILSGYDLRLRRIKLATLCDKTFALKR
jgi:hypothetical protein